MCGCMCECACVFVSNMLRKLIKTHPETVAVAYTEADVRDLDLRAGLNERYNRARDAIDKRTTVIFCDRLDRGLLEREKRKNLKAVVVLSPGDMIGLESSTSDIPVFFLGQDKTTVWQKGSEIEIRPVKSRIDTAWSRMVEFASMLCNNDRIPNWGVFQIVISDETITDEFVYALLLQEWTQKRKRSKTDDPSEEKVRLVLRLVGNKETPGFPSMLFLPWKIKEKTMAKNLAINEIAARGTDRVHYLGRIDAEVSLDITDKGDGTIESRVKKTLEDMQVAIAPAGVLRENEKDRAAPTATVLQLARNPLLEDGIHLRDADFVIDCDAGRVIKDWKAPRIDQKTIKLTDAIKEVDKPVLVEPTTVGRFIWPRRFLAAMMWARMLAGKDRTDFTDAELEYMDRTKKWMDIEKPRLTAGTLDIFRGVSFPKTDDTPGEKIDLPPPLEFVIEDRRVFVFPVACLGPYTSEIDYSYSTEKENTKTREDETTAGFGDWWKNVTGFFKNIREESQREFDRQEKIQEEIEKEKQSQYERNQAEKIREITEAREREAEEERKIEEARLERERMEKEALEKAKTEEERRKIAEKIKANAEIDRLVKENNHLAGPKPSKETRPKSFIHVDDRLFALGNRYSALFISVEKNRVILEDPKRTAGFLIEEYMKARTEYAGFDPVTPIEFREIFARIYRTWDAVVLGEQRLDKAEAKWTGLEYSAERVPEDVVIDPWVARCVMHRMEIKVYNAFYRKRVGVFEFRFNPALREERRPALEEVDDMSVVTTPWVPDDENRLSDFSTIPLLILDRLVEGDWTDHKKVFSAAESYRVRLQAIAWSLPMVQGMRAGFVEKMLRILLPSKQTAGEYATLVGRRANSGGVMKVTQRTKTQSHVAVVVEEKLVVPVGIYYKK